MTYSKNNDLYLQIDGDVVYIEDHTIPTMVNTKIQHPESLVVSANVIHQPAVAKFHQRSGAIVFPYLPEAPYPGQKQPSSKINNRHGSLSYVLPQRMREFIGNNNNRQPTAEETCSNNWVAQAQQHYSFLYHLTQGSLGVYKFPSWTNPPSDVSSAFTCIRGADKDLISEKSEPSWLRKRTIIDGKGVVSHYSSSSMLDSTDVVQRYQSFAEENVCPGRILIV